MLNPPLGITQATGSDPGASTKCSITFGVLSINQFPETNPQSQYGSIEIQVHQFLLSFFFFSLLISHIISLIRFSASYSIFALLILSCIMGREKVADSSRTARFEMVTSARRSSFSQATLQE